MTEESRFGQPIELPWWVFALAVPPVLVAICSLVLAAPLWGRTLGCLTSLAMIAGLARVSRRVESSNMQSVWISLALAVWFFCAVTWAVSVVSAGH